MSSFLSTQLWGAMISPWDAPGAELKQAPAPVVSPEDRHQDPLLGEAGWHQWHWWTGTRSIYDDLFPDHGLWKFGLDLFVVIDCWKILGGCGDWRVLRVRICGDEILPWRFTSLHWKVDFTANHGWSPERLVLENQHDYGKSPFLMGKSTNYKWL